MQTQWGDMRVSDAHVHFFSHGFFSALAAQRKSAYQDLQPLLDWELPSEDVNELADRWIVEMDRYGLSRAALMASVPGDEGSVAAAVARHPDRFYGYFMINPTQRSPETHLASALAGGNLQGICLFPAMHHFSVHDTRLMPIYDIASSHPGTVVFIHCGALSVGVRKKLDLPSHFDMRFSNPMDVHAIAMQFPKLKFVLPHFGSGYFREALMLCDLCPNVYLDTSSSNKWKKYEGLDLKTVFQRARDVCGFSRLLFGTDSSFFPRGWNAKVYQLQSEVLADLGVSHEEAEAFFGGNLERLLAREK
jgi:predicted TIM-barrel fold metal-dependent hydrolase